VAGKWHIDGVGVKKVTFMFLDNVSIKEDVQEHYYTYQHCLDPHSWPCNMRIVHGTVCHLAIQLILGLTGSHSFVRLSVNRKEDLRNSS